MRSGEHDGSEHDGAPAENDGDAVGPADAGPAEDGEHRGGEHDAGPADTGPAEYDERDDGGLRDEASARGGTDGGADHGEGDARESFGEGGAGEDDREAAAAGGASASAGSATSSSAAATSRAADPRELLGEVRAIRRRARLARHAYWFPLVLFGLLVCASVPFYFPPSTWELFRLPGSPHPVSAGVYGAPPGPRFLQSAYLGGLGIPSSRGIAYYWLGAMLLGIAATVFWYRWRGNRVGLRTPARGYLIAGLIIIALALLIPLAGGGAGMLLMPGDLLIRGTFPLVLIGLGLCFLAWSERSVGLAVIAAVYLGLALLASLYDIQNVFYDWFGLSLSPAASSLPNVLLPALVLLLSGAGAWVVQRRHRPRAKPEPAEG